MPTVWMRLYPSRLILTEIVQNKATLWALSEFLCHGDTINGGSNVDKIFGELGNDIINGNAGADIIDGGGGSDTIRGGAGTDGIMGDDDYHGTLTAAQAAALPYSNADTIYGGADDDQILGQLGNDVIFGGAGNDQIAGGLGDDQLYGDDGMNRTFCPEDNHARDRNRLKRGGGRGRVELLDQAGSIAEDPGLVLSVDELLTRLSLHGPIAANVAQFRIFGGISVEEASVVLGISRAVAYRNWKYARDWLRDALEK